MDQPSPQTIVEQPDPLLVAQQNAAAAQQAQALQQQAQGDTASLMARYGTRLALASATTGAPSFGSPLAPASTVLGQR